MSALLERTLEDLTREERELLDLLHRGGVPRKEIADRLGISIESLHARCGRLYGRLRGALSRHFTTLALAGISPPPVTLERVLGLRPSFRAVVIARHLEGLSDAAGAAKLAIPEATYRARLASAYEMLKGDSDCDFSPAREEWKKRSTKGDKGTKETR
jgi:DNA-directed RNA polymerase specialized sigma24 family protein